MDHYVDIRIRPLPEIAPAHLLNAVFAALHKELAATGATTVGVSFPEHDNGQHTLGTLLRVHGSQADLNTLFARVWIRRLADYAQPSPVTAVPENCTYRSVQRVQVKSSSDRIRRRLIKRLMQRENLSEAEAQKKVPEQIDTKRTALPFISLASSSTGQRFKLFIQHAEEVPSAIEGSFNAYGLSNKATIPWF